VIHPEDLDILLPGPTEPGDSWRWATVTQVSPLRVRLDGEATALDTTPDALTPVRIGQRVWCQFAGRRAVVIGSSAGLDAVGLWTDYTPVLTAVTTNPTLGTGGSATGRSTRIGNTIIGNCRIIFGTSGMTPGVGIWRITLPVPAVAAATFAGNVRIRAAGLYTRGQVLTQGTDFGIRYYLAAVNSAMYDVQHNTPGAWTNNDEFMAVFTYEAA